MRTYHNLFHLPHHKSEYISILYTAATLRTFVMSLMSLFLPIYLITFLQNHGLKQKDALILLGAFYILHFFLNILLQPIVARINAKLGIKFGFLIGQLSLALFLILLNSVLSTQSVIFIFIIFSFASAFWWTSYHIFFIEVAKVGWFGREIGTMSLFGVLAGLVAPVTGGAILTYLGFSVLFTLSVVLIVISFLVLFLMKDFEKLNEAGLLDVKEEIRHKKREFVAFVGAGSESVVYSIIWPIFLYFLLGNFLSTGIFFSLIILISGVVAFISGSLCDRISKDKLQRLGSGVVSLSWLGKVVVQNPLGVFIFDAIYRIFGNFFFLPLDAFAYRRAAQENKTRYIAFREISYSIGHIISLLFFIFFISIGFPFWSVFFVGAIFSLFPMLVREG